MLELIDWLKANDKRLWGENASYKQAAKESGFTVAQIRSALFKKLPRVTEIVNGKEKVVDYIWDWTGVITYWKCPDYASGPWRPVEQTSLSESQWLRLKKFVTEHRSLIDDATSTAGFVVRLARSKRLPANFHTISEVMRSKGYKLQAS